MTDLDLTEDAILQLRGKVAVVTGGAQGIGAATVAQLHDAGAHVVFGDLNTQRGQSLAQRLNSTGTSETQEAIFVGLDVSDYQSVWEFFQKALQLHGRVDYAIHCAAITETPGWFPMTLNMETARSSPSTKIFDINLLGTFYVAQIATAAMNESRRSATPESSDKSIVLLSSIAGFKDSPGLFAYTATKHGCLGLMRSLRGYLPQVHGIRINVVCPWATDTPMFVKVFAVWEKHALPLNTPGQVARVVLEASANHRVNGQALYVAGGEAVDIDQGINRLEPEWMGHKKARELAIGQGVLGTGMDW